MIRMTAAGAVVCVLVAGAAEAGPTFSRDVAPILYKNCTNCHRPGEIGPMSLLTYADGRPWAKSIATRVANGTMPPARLTAFSFAPGMNRAPTPEQITAKRDLNDRPAPRVLGGWLGGFAPGQG